MHRVSHEPLERKNSDGFIQKRKKSAGLVVPPYILPSMTHLSPSQENIVETKVQAIQSEVPIYVSVMKKTYIGAIKHNMLVRLTPFLNLCIKFILFSCCRILNSAKIERRKDLVSQGLN